MKKTYSAFKYMVIIAFAVLTLSATAIIAEAAGCAGGCPCDPNQLCKPKSCDPGCGGHDWNGTHDKYKSSSSQSRTCTRGGYGYETWEYWIYCTRSTCNEYNPKKPGSEKTYRKNEWSQGASGHSWSSWHDHSSTEHKRTCGNGHHSNPPDGSKTQYATHVAGDEHQHNDWYWHQDCTVCGHDDYITGPNTGTVTFHYGQSQGSENKSGNTDSSIISPNSKTITGKTLVGWKLGTSAEQPVNNVTQVPGASNATGKYDWNTNTAKSVREAVPKSQNTRYGTNVAAGVWEYNYVAVHYRTGYGEYRTKDKYVDFVDYTQSLTSRPMTEFKRTGYDIITKGWFTTGTNESTATETSFTHHINKAANAVCGDTAAFPFNKAMTATQWSNKVINNHITDIYLYPHWRAHTLTVKYNMNGGSGNAPSSIWFYDDGQSGTAQKTYYVTNIVPTRAGYTFMGWGNSNKWCTERYAMQSAGDGSGAKTAYDGTTAKKEAKTAQDWATYFKIRSQFDAADQTVTFYAQWERIIAYRFYYYNDNANNAYYLNGGFQDYNIATVAFHNDDNEYLWMDIYSHDTDKNAAGNTIKNIEETIAFNHSLDWAARGFKYNDPNGQKSVIDIGKNDVNKVLNLHTSYDKTYFKTSDSDYTKLSDGYYQFWNKATGSHSASAISNNGQPDSFLCSSVVPTRYIKIYPGYSQTANYYMTYERVVKTQYHDYGTDIKHNGEAQDTAHVDRQTSYMNSAGLATTPTFTTHTECPMKYTESDAAGKGKTEPWIAFGWASSVLNDADAKKEAANRTYTLTYYNGKKAKVAGMLEPQFIDQKATFKTNRDIDFYGLYYKDVKITYDLNGGNGIRKGKGTRFASSNTPASPATSMNALYFQTSETTKDRRYANTGYGSGTQTYNKLQESADPSITETEYFLALPFWTQGGQEGKLSVYDFNGWTYDKLAVNTPLSYSHRVIGSRLTRPNGATNNGHGDYYFTPLVSDTIYASWTNRTDDEVDKEDLKPDVQIKKTVQWCEPQNDNANVDFDNLQNIDPDGIAKVTITVTVKNAQGGKIHPTGLVIKDFYDTTVWKYYTDSTHQLVANGCTITSNDKVNGVIVAKANDNTASNYTIKYIYYLQIHEDYWNVPEDTREYTNKITYLDEYLDSLVNPDDAPNKWTLDDNNTHYAKDEAARKQYVVAEYSIKGEDGYTDSYFVSDKINNVDQVTASVVGPTPYVVMREVNWRPTAQDITELNIQTSTNVYRNINSPYAKTYFVQYNNRTQNTDNNANSTFDIFSNASLRRSYNYYNVSDNLLDIYQVSGKKNQVIDNNIGTTVSDGGTSTTITDTTNNDLATGYTTGKLVNVSSAINYRKAVTAVYNTKKYTVNILNATGKAHLSRIITDYAYTTTNVPGNKVNTKNYIKNGVAQRGQVLSYTSWINVNRYLDVIFTSKNKTNIIYPYGGLTSVSTLYATNQNNVSFSIYPYVRTTNAQTGEKFNTTRFIDPTTVPDRNTINNKRLDITIDATNPIITADSRILTERVVDGTTEKWVTSWKDQDGNEVGAQKFDGSVSDGYTYDGQRSDGYIDINLVHSDKNPIPKQQVLTFRFKDDVSGINSPMADTADWIDASNENIQIKLERVGTAPGENKVLFNTTDVTKAADNNYQKQIGALKSSATTNGNIVKVTYDSLYAMNKTGQIDVILDPTNDDVLGHLRLTIRVYDNVSNWTEKVYDLYVFCVTGEVSQSSTITRYDPDAIKNQFRNGEMGIVNVDAGGFADRVEVDFPENLVNLYQKEASVRVSFMGARSLDGDYPHDDYVSFSAEDKGSIKAYGTETFILPYDSQVVRWGYTSNRLGGIKLAVVDTGADYGEETSTTPVNNSILREHLSELIDNFANSNNSATTKTDTACVVGTTLYTYPTYSNSVVKTYQHLYEVDMSTGFTYNGKAYPNRIILDGNTEIIITYTNTPDGYVASVPATSMVETADGKYETSWTPVKDNDGNIYAKRALSHYFYVPLESPIKYSSKGDFYNTKVTVHKDSEKAFDHYVNVQFTWSNDYGVGDPIFDDFQTVIDDN